jgi:hypothetical protein
MRDLDRHTRSIREKAEKAGNLETALKAIGQIRQNQELIGKLLGELSKTKPATSESKQLHFHSLSVRELRALAEGREIRSIGEFGWKEKGVAGSG